jgi:Protein of unknown function (DUF3995)
MKPKRSDLPRDRTPPWFAYFAAVLGTAYAGVSAYWAIGGTGLLDTVGGSLERTARTGGTAVVAALWAVALLKLVAAGLPLGALSATPGSRRRRVLCRLAKLEVVILVGYGLPLTGVGLLVQAGVISRGAHADPRGLAWHVFLWDPWFLIWGLAVALALRTHPAARIDRS